MPKTVKQRGRLYVESEGNLRYLCSMSRKLAAQVESEQDIAIPLLRPDKAIPALSEGKCPLCSMGLKVESVGRYGCDDCGSTFVNTEGYRLPALLADEVILAASSGVALSELTTVGVASAIPSPMNTPDGTAVGICPRCYNELNKRGECKCGWTPSGVDKLWEQVRTMVERTASVTSTGDLTIEFEIAGEACKIVIGEQDDGYRYNGRFVNIAEDRIQEITGRPQAVINFLAKRLEPVCQVNRPTNVNFPITETGHRLSTRSDSGADKRVRGRISNNRHKKSRRTR